MKRSAARLAAFALAVGALFFAAALPLLAAPAAGTVIGNQATATYNDSSGASRTTTSNLVQTTVTQVKSFTLTANGARTAAPGQTIYYPHTITNTGNGTDTYALNPPSSTNFGAAGPHTSLAYYIDANGDGLPDNAIPITTTGALAAGGIFRFVVAGTVPAAAAVGSSADIVVSVTDTTPTTLTNTDTTTVANSVVGVTKSLSAASGPSPAGPLTVRLTYSNTGTAAATNLQLTDVIPAGMTYVAGSGRWSVSGGAALTDASDGVEQAGPFPPGIDYRQSGGTVTAIIPSVAAGASAMVTFQVMVNGNLSPRTISNTAQYQTSTQPAANTNTASYQVLASAAVEANGSPTNSASGVGEPVTLASAAAGSTFTFANYIWNRGNATDTFDITIAANNFPAGTVVTLLQQDGATPLLDSGGSPAPDTGPVPGVGAACAPPFVADTGVSPAVCGYRVVVRVTLPASAAGGPYSITKRATSVFNTAVFEDVIDTLTAVIANTVDVTNNTARFDSLPPGTANAGNAATTGFGATGAAVIGTNAVTPSAALATTTRFALYVNNTGALTDSFNLSFVFAATSAAGVTPPALPAGWSVTFRADGGAGNCSTVGAALAATGPLNAGTNRLVCAEVSVPSIASGGAIAGDYDLDFIATSATNGAVNDSKRDRVRVAAVRSFTLTPNNAQSSVPGGTLNYTHTLTNAGNATDTATFAAGCLSDSRAAQGWTSAAYIDTNGNGVLDLPPTGDTLVVCGAGSVTLAAGQSRFIFVRVVAPASASAADPPNVTTLTATYGAASAVATDTSTVANGLTLAKEQQGLGTAGCTNNNAPAGGYAAAPIAAGPNTLPGACIAYRVTATNTSGAVMAGVVVNDVVPANTTIRYGCSGNGASTPTVTVGAIAASTPMDGTTGTVSANVGTLNAGQAAVLYFCVRIDP